MTELLGEKVAEVMGFYITLNKLFKQIRILIAKECENISKLQGEIEIDESYFLFHNYKQEEAKRIRGKRGRGAGGKTPVFDMLKRDGNVYTQVVINCKAKTLIPILREFSELQESTIYSDLLKLMMD